MPRTSPDFVPAYRKHKHTKQAWVVLSGKTHYLGRYGTKASRDEYDRLVAQWMANGRQTVISSNGLMVSEVILAYFQHAQDYYQKNGQPTSEVDTVKQALKPLKELYGPTPAKDFGPLAMTAVRQRMVERGWCRSYVNKQVSRLRHVFKWAAAKELIPASVFQALQTLDGLRRGRSEARETEPVKPVAEAMIDATRDFMPPPVRAMVDLQLFTAMRPGEVTTIRGCDLDVSGRVWIYKPESHKTEHHGITRTIFIGPKAQEVLRPWLRTDLQAYLFSPADAEELRNAERRRNRRSPMTPSQAKRQRKKNRRRAPGDHYDVPAYRRAIDRACDRAFPLPEPLAQAPTESRKQWKERLTTEDKKAIREWWRHHSFHPHQLRHSAATNLRKEFGIEVARAVLGHSSVAVSELYAEMDNAAAAAAIAKVG
jgi:integrase